MKTDQSAIYLSAGLAGFCQKVEKAGFFMVKTGQAKILFAGKSRCLLAKIGLCQNCRQSKLEH